MRAVIRQAGNACATIQSMAIASINPATGEKLKEFSPFDDAEIEKRLSRAEKAFKSYRRTTLTERAELLHAVSELLFQETKTFAEIITLEMGKLFRDSVAEIEKCARGCRFYAENGARFLEEEPAQTDAAESYVEYQPLGACARGDAVEFSFLAGVSICCAGFDCRQRRLA